jgi:malonate transporter and related proteins
MNVFYTVFPILTIVVFGYVSANRRLLSYSDCRSISRFSFNFLIPLLLFIGTVHTEIPGNMEWMFLLSYYVVLLFIFGLSVFLGKVIFKFSASEQSVFSMGASYSNATIVGIPVCVYALGENSILPLFTIISIHNLILFSLGFIVAERNGFSISSLLQNILTIVRQLISSPITGSLILGGLVNIFDIAVFKPLDDAITMMSKAAVPAALFALGATLNQFEIKGHLAPALMIVTLKMVFFPLLVWLLVFQLFAVSRLWASTALLTAAMPVGISAYIFSQQYKACEAPIAASIIISTTASILTLSALIAYVQPIV